MAQSSELTPPAKVLMSQYNNLRKDVLDTTLGHTHSGTGEDGALVSTLNIDAGLLYTDITNNRVGIGTTSPEAQLHIEGGSSGVDARLRLNQTAAGGRSWDIISAVSTFHGAGTDGDLLFWSSGLGNVLVLDNSGNVGIGTTGPGFKLHVAHDSAAPALFGIERTDAAGNVVMQLKNTLDTAEIAIRADISGRPLRIQRSGGNDLVITSTGNVGIGTTAPQITLEVNGILRVLDDPVYPTSGDGLEIIFDQDLANAYIQSYDRDTSSWRPLFIRGNRIILEKGNVGIGTPSPGSKLHVETSSGSVQLRLRAPGDGTNAAMINFYDSTDDKFWHLTRRDSAYASEPNWFSFYFWDGASWKAAMKLKPDGNVFFPHSVGIGTTSPEQTLDVAGTAQLRRVANADATNTLRDSNVLQFQGAYWDGTASQNISFKIFHDVATTTPSSYLSFLTPEDTEIFRLESGLDVLVTPEGGGRLIVNDYSITSGYDFGVNGDMICFTKDATIPTFELCNEVALAGDILGQIYFSDISKRYAKIQGYLVSEAAGSEDGSIHFRGLWNGAENLAFRFNMDGSGYADVGWYTFSPDVPEAANPKEYLRIALEDALKPKKPFPGLGGPDEELEKYKKDISKIAIAIARYCESVEERLQRIEKRLGII